MRTVCALTGLRRLTLLSDDAAGGFLKNGLLLQVTKLRQLTQLLHINIDYGAPDMLKFKE